MSDVVFYRKYRPRTFAEVRGQGHIIGVLERAVKEGTVSHAYLFAGPRGTGKTSVARILAQELTCSPSDLYEIDGASNRGIDEIRNLREAVGTLPFDSPVKVYVIDEVHMLTREAFNALLKTLEEPPEYVIFILATTEFHKVPETIVSRCQNFTFKKPTQAVLKKTVLDIAEEEKVKLDDDAASLIAFLGDGSFRDTEGILEQVVTLSSGKAIAREDVENITGAPPQALIKDYITSIGKHDPQYGILALGKAREKNIDMKIFARLLMKYIRFALLLSLAPDVKPLIKEEVGDDEFAYLEELGCTPAIKVFPRALKILIDAYDDIRKSYVRELPLELALIEITGSDGAQKSG